MICCVTNRILIFNTEIILFSKMLTDIILIDTHSALRYL